MVVQCPTCQSKFRIADEKVTERGVRLRCTSCRNVFPVRKEAGGAETAAALRAQPPPPPARPALQRPAAASGLAEPRRLDVDDLFGMAELTGDAPLGDMARGLERAAPPAPRPPPKPMPNFDDLDIDVDEDVPPPVAPRPPTGPQAARPPTGPQAARPPTGPQGARPPTGPQRGNGVSPAADLKPPPPPPDAHEPPPAAPGIADPFAGVDLGAPAPVAVDVAPLQQDAPPAPRAEPAPVPTPAPDAPPGRGLVSSALTGLVGATLAIAVLVVAALSGDASLDWLGLGSASDVVATGVVSGLYDTASGKPVFFVRGRVENHGKKVHGPVRVTAELVADGSPEVRAAAIAGAEPTPEDVWSLRSGVDVERLNHALESAQAERKLQPGASLPFFAMIFDPPPDLQRHRLHVKVEPVDAWVTPPPRKGR